MPENEQTEVRPPPIGTPTSERARSFFGRNSASDVEPEVEEEEEDKGRPTKWSMGVLNDHATHEVPGKPEMP